MMYVDVPVIEIPYESLIVIGLVLITLVIAIYAAILSTVAIVWNSYNQFKKDKGNLEVACYTAKLAIDGVIDPEETLVYKLTNVGTKPLLVTGVGGKTKGVFFVLESENLPLPIELKSGGFVVLMTDPSSLNVLNDDLEYLCAFDSLGKKYKTKNIVLKRLIHRQKEITKNKPNEKKAA